MNFPIGRWKLRNGKTAELFAFKTNNSFIEGELNRDVLDKDTGEVLEIKRERTTWDKLGNHVYNSDYDLMEFFRDEANYQKAICAFRASRDPSESDREETQREDKRDTSISTE